MNSDLDRIGQLMDFGAQMRVGRRLRRTLYLVDPESTNALEDLCVGIVDSEELAAEIVNRWNEQA